MEEFRDLAVNNRAELERIKTGAISSSLYNDDLAPTGPEQRTWTTYNIAALWIGMAKVITTYALAAGLMAANVVSPSSGLVYLGLSVIGGRATEPAREPEAT